MLAMPHCARHAAARVALGVGAGAGARRQALDAVGGAVAHQAAAAGRAGRDRAVGGRARAALVGRADVAVDRQVGVVVEDLRVAGAVALQALAVARGRVDQLGAGGREGESADAGRAAGSGAAGGVAARAVRGDRAADALAGRVAVVRAAAVGVRRHHRVRRRAGRADVVGARVAVVGHVGVVVGGRDGAVGGALAALAVARRSARSGPCRRPRACCRRRRRCRCGARTRTRCPGSRRRRCTRRRSCRPDRRTGSPRSRDR